MEEIGDRRPPNLELDVVPGRPGPVPPVDGDRLGIAHVVLVVVSSMAKIDPAHERHALAGGLLTLNENHLLMVRAESTNPLVEQDLAAPLVDDLRELRIFLLAELLLIRVRNARPDLGYRPRDSRRRR
jgi:hypothetical protein